MALTSKPITTISYNTEAFLIDRLERLFKDQSIDDYRVIMHEGEDGDKDHFHVWISPNRRIDTMQLQENFKEIYPDPTKTKPLGVLPFRSGDRFHWIMYVLHDPDYLKSHHSDNDGDGKLPYTLEQIITPFPEQLQRDYIRAVQLRQTDAQKIIDGIRSGTDVIELAYTQNLRPSEIAQVLHLIKMNQAMEGEKRQIDKLREQYGYEIERHEIREAQMYDEIKELRRQIEGKPLKQPPESPFDDDFKEYMQKIQEDKNEL